VNCDTKAPSFDKAKEYMEGEIRCKMMGWGWRGQGRVKDVIHLTSIFKLK
jgi:hypothetical protein